MKTFINSGTRKHAHKLLTMPVMATMRKGVYMRIVFTGNNSGICYVLKARGLQPVKGFALPNVMRFLRSLT